jgi:hypothetical protein
MVCHHCLNGGVLGSVQAEEDCAEFKVLELVKDGSFLLCSHGSRTLDSQASVSLPGLQGGVSVVVVLCVHCHIVDCCHRYCSRHVHFPAKKV